MQTAMRARSARVMVMRKGLWDFRRKAAFVPMRREASHLLVVLELRTFWIVLMGSFMAISFSGLSVFVLGCVRCFRRFYLPLHVHA